MTCKISCLRSEKSENAVQRGHRCLHIYLSGQFLKVPLQKHTKKKKKSPFRSLLTHLETVNLAGETSACITKFGFNICKGRAKSMSEFFSERATLRHRYSTIYGIKLLFYTGL